MSMDDFSNVNFAREKLYAFLSRLYAREVDEESLKTIISVQPTVESLASSQDMDELKEGSRLLRDFVRQASGLIGQQKKDLITNLRAEYAGLFLAAGMRYRRLLTCESAYLGKHGTYYDKPFDLVRNAYKKSGFEKRKDFLEPEDHIAVELDYMANLCKQTHLSLDAKKIEDALRFVKLQRDFLRDHLLKWAPNLCKSLKETAESPLYKSLAYLTNGFISMEAQVVEELLETQATNISKPAAR